MKCLQLKEKRKKERQTERKKERKTERKKRKKEVLVRLVFCPQQSPVEIQSRGVV